MELGTGEALVSFLDEKGVPTMAQRTSIICPQSLMAPCSESERQSQMAMDGMSKYDQMIDNESAYEVLEDEREQDAEKAKLEAERAAFEKEKAEYEKQKAKEEEAERKKKEKEAEALQKKKEKEAEAAQKKKEKAAERRKTQIERQLINTGMQVVKRGLFKTLFK